VIVVVLVNVERVLPADNLSFLSRGVDGDAAAPAALLKSKAVPGVLGVLVAEPNDAKAPDPKPKAVAAPPVGEEMLVVLSGAILSKGFDRPP
jgi:hypothetical protein